jgi:hypothetical protein
MTEKERIMKRLQEHLDKACETIPYNRIVGIFLQGSQNYGLSYGGSDIDSKVIVIPSLDEIVLNKKPISEVTLMENNEHVDLKDIRLMFDCFKKQNINFVEVLFTEYFILNPLYAQTYFQEVLYYKEEIAHYSEWSTLNCIKGMMMEKFKALKHPYPTLKERIEKFSYDPKQLHHSLRMLEFCERYINGEPYKDCLKSKQSDFLIKVKDCSKEAYYTVEEAEILSKQSLDKVDKMVENWRVGKTADFKVFPDTQLKKALSIIIKDSLKKQLEDE